MKRIELEVTVDNDAAQEVLQTLQKIGFPTAEDYRLTMRDYND